jgi:hypothetical protein
MLTELSASLRLRHEMDDHRKRNPIGEAGNGNGRKQRLAHNGGRGLDFHVAFFGCWNRMNEKLSSPVLRGLDASSGTRLLGHIRFPRCSVILRQNLERHSPRILIAVNQQ